MISPTRHPLLASVATNQQERLFLLGVWSAVAARLALLVELAEEFGEDIDLDEERVWEAIGEVFASIGKHEEADVFFGAIYDRDPEAVDAFLLDGQLLSLPLIRGVGSVSTLA